MPLAGPEFFSRDDDHDADYADPHDLSQDDSGHQEDYEEPDWYVEDTCRDFNDWVSRYNVPRLEDLYEMGELVEGAAPTYEDPDISITDRSHLIATDVAEETARNADPYNWLIATDEDLYLNAEARGTSDPQDLSPENQQRFLAFARATDDGRGRNIFHAFEDFKLYERERAAFDDEIRHDLNLEPRPDDADVRASHQGGSDPNHTVEIVKEKRIARVRRDPDARPRTTPPAAISPLPPQPAPAGQPHGRPVPRPPIPRSGRPAPPPMRAEVLPGVASGSRASRRREALRAAQAPDRLGRAAIDGTN